MFFLKVLCTQTLYRVEVALRKAAKNEIFIYSLTGSGCVEKILFLRKHLQICAKVMKEMMTPNIKLHLKKLYTTYTPHDSR